MTPFSKFALSILAAGAVPFPAPKLIPVTEVLRSDAGTVVSVDAAKGQLVMGAPAGPITFRTQEAQVVGSDGKGLGTAAALQPGQSVRVYYVIDNGAVAKEIDVQG